MSISRARLPEGYFHDLYRANADPWGLGTSEYERQKYRATLDILPDRRWQDGFEIGCAIGVLTRMLASRVDRLLAVDVEELALRQARARCADLEHVELARMEIPGAWPDRAFDLILISEVLYYFTPDAIALTARQAVACVKRDSRVVLVHWTHETDLPLGGDEAAEIFIGASAPDLFLTNQVRTGDYRIDVLSRGGAVA